MRDMTVTQRLADHLLDGSLENFVLSRRAKSVSWRKISNELRDTTGVDVAYETLRSWYLPNADGRQWDAAPAKAAS